MKIMENKSTVIGWNKRVALRVTSGLMRKKLEHLSIVTQNIITTTTQRWNRQNDPYRSFSLPPMRLKVCDKDTATGVASNYPLLLRHIQPVYSNSTIPRNTILLCTSRVIEARG